MFCFWGYLIDTILINPKIAKSDRQRSHNSVFYDQGGR
jgi:hypothetical protein